MLPEIEEMVAEWKNYLKKRRGYLEEDLAHNLFRIVTVNGEEHEMTAELAAKPKGANFILLKFERSNIPLVPLERRTAAIARVIDSTPFPFAVLTSGSDSIFIDLIEVKTSYDQDFEIPSRAESTEMLKELSIQKLSDEEKEKEERIFATFDSLKCETCEE